MDHKFFTVVDKANKFLWNTASFGMVFISLSVFYEVICRYVFHHSNAWVGELSGYLFAFIVFLAAPYTYSQGGMTAIDAITGKLSKKGQLIAKLFAITVGFFFLAVLCWKSFQLMSLSFTKGWKSNTALKFPLWLPQLAVPLGSFLLCFTSIVMFAKEIMNYREYKKTADDNTKEEDK